MPEEHVADRVWTVVESRETVTVTVPSPAVQAPPKLGVASFVTVPPEGAVRETNGGVLSTVTVVVAEVKALPARSVVTTCRS